MTKFTFFLVGDPLPKERPRLGARGRVFTPDKTLAYEQEIAGACLNQMFLEDIRIIEQPLEIKMLFERATNHRVDLDNLIKAVLDGLNGVAFTDDQLVYNLQAVKVLGVGREHAKVSVTLETLNIPVVVKKGKRKK